MTVWNGSILTPLVTQSKTLFKKEGFSIHPFQVGKNKPKYGNGIVLPFSPFPVGKIVSKKRGFHTPAFKCSEPVKSSITTRSGALGFDYTNVVIQERVLEGEYLQKIAIGYPGTTLKGHLLKDFPLIGKIIANTKGYYVNTHVGGIQQHRDTDGNIVTFNTTGGQTLPSPKASSILPSIQGHYLPAFIGGNVLVGGHRLKATHPGIAYSVGIEIIPPFEPRLFPKHWHPAIYNGQKKNSQPLDK